MQGIIGSLRDCPVIIYDTDSNHVADAIIVGHDKTYNIIEISKILESVEIGTRLNLLVIAPGGTAEFSGTLKNALNTGHEIALFNKRDRKVRGAVRHKFNSPALIKNILTVAGPVPLDPPLQITVDNISATGLMIKSLARHFEVGTVLEIHLNIQGRNSILYASIIRECKKDKKDASFGCKLVFMKE